jgi:precorrin-8X/cobalt-precorrin-8 methylmutase
MRRRPMVGRTGIIIIGHGSKRREANDTLLQVAGELRMRLGMEDVEAAFFSLAQPDVPTVIGRLVDRGCRRIVAQPFFLFKGNHTSVDIPQLLEECKRDHQGVEIEFLDTLGADPRLVDVVEENVLKHMPDGDAVPIQNPHEIEQNSMEYIESRLDQGGVDEEYMPVVKRVIHSTADFDFARTLIFHPRAVEAGIEALSGGCNIIVDVNMVMAGITRNSGSKVMSAIHHQDVKETARSAGITRAAAAMEKLKNEMKGGLVAIGNAPTALFKVMEMVERGEAEPALIVGMPVGFVGAAESKAALSRLDYPHITNAGPRGGSPVAAAVVNALAIMGQERRG